MKTVISCAVLVLVLVPTAFATGQALDPRVPGLQKQVRVLKGQMATVRVQVAETQAGLDAKVDKGCVEIIPVVIRPGYVYQSNDGSLIIYKAFDEYNSAIDSAPNRLMQLKDGC